MYFNITYRMRLRVKSIIASRKLALTYERQHNLLHVQSLLTIVCLVAPARPQTKKYTVHSSALLSQRVHRSVCRKHFALLRSAKRTTSFPAGARRQTNTNGIPYLDRYGTTTSSRESLLSPDPPSSLPPRDWEDRRQALLSFAGDEIRYFVKVISPRKVSFR